MPPQQIHRPDEESTDEQTPDVTGGDDGIGAKLAEAVRDGAEDLRMSEFTEPSAQAAHGHSPAKGEGTHDIRGAFNVREAFIRAHFDGGVVPNGHEGVHALLAGKEAFIAAEEDIFEDTHDRDAGRWREIRKTAKGAPIPPGRRAALDAALA